MAKKLTGADITYWYRGLNVARTQTSIGLSSITESSFGKDDTSQRVLSLLNNIKNTRSANTFLNMSDYSVNSGNFDPKDKIWEVDRETIDKAIVSLLRVCPNISCKTVCTNTGANTNQLHTNGTCSFEVHSNSRNSDGICSNGANSNGANSNGTCANGMQSVCSTGSDGYTNTNWDGNCSNGTNSNVAYSQGAKVNGTNSNGTCPNALKSNGTNSNGSKTNGNTNEIYDPNTVAYSAKNHYSEEEAKKRI